MVQTPKRGHIMKTKHQILLKVAGHCSLGDIILEGFIVSKVLSMNRFLRRAARARGTAI